MNEENKSYLWHWFILVFVALVMLAVVYKTFWLAGTSVGDYLLSQPTPTEKAPTIVITTLEKPPVTPKPIEKVESKVKEEKAQEKPKKDITECKTLDCYKKHPDYTYDPAIEKTAILSDKIQVVACLNEKKMTIHQPNNGNCYLGKGGKWKNILLPPKSHIDQFKKIFWDDYKYRLAIANFEGSFNENAQNPYAIGYLQTLRSHKVKKDIVSQLNWLKNREDKNTWVACGKYEKENFTLFGTMNIEKGKIAKYTCMARRHYGAFSPWDGKHWHHSVMYAKRYKVTTEYYLSLSF